MADTAQSVLLITALRDEMLPAARRLRLERRDAATFAGQLAGVAVAARIGGCGRQRMLAALEQSLPSPPPSRLLLIGLAGALSPQLQTGDVLRPRWVIDDQRRAWRLHDDSPPTLAAHADAAEAETLLTTDHVVRTPADKLIMHRSHRAAAVDMESHHVAGFAAQRGLPLTVIRAVGDDADTTLPPGVEQWVNDDGSPRVGKALAALLRRPTMLGSLLRLKRDSQRAAQNLAEAVEKWLAKLT